MPFLLAVSRTQIVSTFHLDSNCFVCYFLFFSVIYYHYFFFFTRLKTQCRECAIQTGCTRSSWKRMTSTNRRKSARFLLVKGRDRSAASSACTQLRYLLSTCLISLSLSCFLYQVANQAGPCETPDMEDFGAPNRPLQPAILISTKRKRASQGEDSQTESQDLELTQSWREILGPPPPMGTTQVLHTVSKETHHSAKMHMCCLDLAVMRGLAACSDM